jgi:hypothetical protein
LVVSDVRSRFNSACVHEATLTGFEIGYQDLVPMLRPAVVASIGAASSSARIGRRQRPGTSVDM